MYYFLLTLWVGSNLLFLPIHSIGLYAFPRRISDYPISFLFWSYVMLCGMLFLVCLVLFAACLFSILMFWDYCFYFVSIFLYCLYCFFYFNTWLPYVMAVYLLLIDFAHIVLDYLFIILCFCFVFYIYFINIFMLYFI
jgi:hypothetical protein